MYSHQLEDYYFSSYSFNKVITVQLKKKITKKKSFPITNDLIHSFQITFSHEYLTTLADIKNPFEGWNS